MLREPSGRWQHCLQRKPWQLPYHSFQHDVMACSPAPVAFDMRQYMPQLTPVTGAEDDRRILGHMQLTQAMFATAHGD